MSVSSRRVFKSEQMLTEEERAEARSLLQACVDQVGSAERLGAEMNIFSSRIRLVVEGKANAGRRMYLRIQNWAIENGVLP